MKTLLKRILSRFGLYISKGYKTYLFNNQKIVKRSVYGREVWMPRSHSLPYNLAHFPYYNSNLQRLISEYARHHQGKFSIVDVGANIGDTLLMIREVSDMPVHCFEGDPFHFRLLEKNSAGLPGCFLHKTLLSDKPASMKIASHTSFGTSQFMPDDSHGLVAEFSSIDSFFSDRGEDVPIGVIKVDTDGFDLKILYGAEAVIRKYQPILFLEYDPVLFEKNGDDGLTFLAFLERSQYEHILLYDNFGKLVSIASLKDKRLMRSLFSYIKERKGAFPFYDLAVFPVGEQPFFDTFAAAELSLFEQ